MPKTVSIRTALISIIAFAAITMGGLIGTKVLTQHARVENDLARANLGNV
jgi:hypothetical protein